MHVIIIYLSCESILILALAIFVVGFYYFIIFIQVIPNISNASIGSGNKSSTLYAFVSVEDKTKPDDQHKALRGQIRIYNLTSSRRVGGLLAEVRSYNFMDLLVLVKPFIGLTGVS